MKFLKIKISKYLNSLLLVTITLISTSCENAVFQDMKPGEYGVVFVSLPRFLGGGVQERILKPGEKEFIWPWQSIYRVDTTFQIVSWGGIGEGSDSNIADYVETRTVDGNEVGLAMTIQYHINPAMVRHVVSRVSTNMERIRALVSAVARADIRTHMNLLSTRDYFNERTRNQAIEKVELAMKARLDSEGIVIDSVAYKDHRFERISPEGKDDRYQKEINETQKLYQEVEQESKRRARIGKEKQRDLEISRARKNKIIEEAIGYTKQKEIQGRSLQILKENEAKSITVKGQKFADSLKSRIEALSGPGGEALLRREIAQALSKQNSQYILLNQGSGSKDSNGNVIDIQKTDTNDLLRQMGIVFSAQELVKEPLKEKKPLP
jgi:hypothetical protein